MEFTITPADDYCGIRYWRSVSVHPLASPRYEIYVYMGYEEEKNLHFFRHRGTNAIIWRRYEELKTPSFGPFLLNFKSINEALARMEKKA